jgi:hypothetical protein
MCVCVCVLPRVRLPRMSAQNEQERVEEFHAKLAQDPKHVGSVATTYFVGHTLLVTLRRG